MPIEQQVIKQAELKNSQQISTFYSGRYEEQCYLCQHGLHGKEVASTQNNVVYQTPEVIVSQTIGQPLTTKKTIRNNSIDKNLSQIINTPPRNDSVYSQQLQQSPVQNIQSNLPQNQQIIPTTQQQLQQSQLQNFQLNVPQNQQLINTNQFQLQQSPVQNIQLNVPQNQQVITTNQQPLQQSQFQNFQLNVPQNQQLINTNQQPLQQSPVQNLQLKVQQSQIIPQMIQQNQVVQQIPQVEDYQVTTVPQKVIQETLTTVQEQQITPQEQVEMYWRYKVYELQERVYELMNQISLQKQGNLQHQRTGSQIKKSTEDSFKVEQAKQEILQLESQLKLKQKTSIDLRNKLNLMIYRQDPTDEATKYKEQELQQLRQKYNTLNFKHQSNVEDIAMTQAILEAIKSGKGYKLVSVREQQQTSSYNRSSQGQQNYN
ncbi:unnamed protein product [Paramecium primaurelia]|nr:unnamed protein product [Paramecium primaurelia]